VPGHLPQPPLDDRYSPTTDSRRSLSGCMIAFNCLYFSSFTRKQDGEAISTLEAEKYAFKE
jgi:hypothetical protein